MAKYKTPNAMKKLFLFIFVFVSMSLQAQSQHKPAVIKVAKEQVACAIFDYDKNGKLTYYFIETTEGTWISSANVENAALTYSPFQRTVSFKYPGDKETPGFEFKVPQPEQTVISEKMEFSPPTLRLIKNGKTIWTVAGVNQDDEVTFILWDNRTENFVIETDKTVCLFHKDKIPPEYRMTKVSYN